MNLRKQARGRGCQVRIPHVCNFNSETTVLAHYRLAGISGMGMKSPDAIGACINGRFFVSRFELEGNRLQMHKRRLPSVADAHK